MDQQAPPATIAAPSEILPEARRDGSGWRIAVLVAGAVLLPALLMAASGRSAWRGAWAEAERELSIAAEAAAESALRMIERHAMVAARVADLVSGLDDAALLRAAPALRATIAPMVAELAHARGVVVTGARGDVVLYFAPSGLPTVWPTVPTDGFLPIGRNILVSGAFQPTPGARPAFGLARDRPGHPGRIVAIVDADGFGARLGAFVEEQEDSAALVRSDGQILARQPPFAAPPPALEPGQPLMRAMAADVEGGGLAGTTPRDGRQVLVRFRRLESVPVLVVATARPQAVVTQRWLLAIAPLLMFGVPAMLGLGVLAWLVRGKQRALQAALAGLEHRVADRTASLREGEERLQLAIGAGRFGTWESDLASGITSRSARTNEIFGFGTAPTSGPLAGWTMRLHPDDRARVSAAWDAVSGGRVPSYREDYRFQRPDGVWRWVESTAGVVRADPATGRPLRLAGTVRDITDRREEEARRELLTQEVNHRARNALAVVQAILRLTRAEDTTAYAKVVEGRIAALARAQSLLAAENWTGAPLAAVLAEELAPFGATRDGQDNARARFDLEGPQLRLRAEAVQPLGIVCHELATNAAKHGALSIPQGCVRVVWDVDEPAGLLRLSWTEDGGPAPGLPKRRGVGSRVIEATVVGQLGGSVERRWPESGLVCEIAVPLAHVRAGPA